MTQINERKIVTIVILIHIILCNVNSFSTARESQRVLEIITARSGFRKTYRYLVSIDRKRDCNTEK